MITIASLPLVRIPLAGVLVAVAFGACTRPDVTGRLDIPPALVIATTAYERAGETALADTAPLELPGLHNVFVLSEQVISGAEPEGDVAFAQLAEMGVMTILSVDGKLPDVDAAAAHGLRYVHVPIQYKGITEDEVVRITKTFRELEGPFYVHCFHGQHRGPAAAALGRLALDASSRDVAIAEMRQWCGTSPKYEGLYRTIAVSDIPGAEVTEAYAWDFPAAHPLGGIAQIMVGAARAHDRIRDLIDNDWRPDPDHPDIDAANEAAILSELFARAATLPDVASQPGDFRGWMTKAATQARALHEAVVAARRGAAEPARAVEAFAALRASCTSCHGVYRD